MATSAGRSLFTGNVKGGCGLGEAVFVLGNAAVESRVGRLGIANCQPRASAAVRRCVDARVVPYINPVPLPSTYHTHSIASDIAIFVLKRDVKLQLTN